MIRYTRRGCIVVERVMLRPNGMTIHWNERGFATVISQFQAGSKGQREKSSDACPCGRNVMFFS